MFQVKCLRSGHRIKGHNVTNVSAVNATMDRLSDFKLGMAVVIKADKDWRGVGRLRLQCIAIATFSSKYYCY